MAKGKGLRITAWIFIVLGLFVTYGTHIGILAMGLNQDLLGGHAMINLLASVFITLGVIFLAAGWSLKR